MGRQRFQRTDLCGRLSSLLHLEGLVLSPFVDIALGAGAAWNTLAVDVALSDNLVVRYEVVDDAVSVSQASEFPIPTDSGEEPCRRSLSRPVQLGLPL